MELELGKRYLIRSQDYPFYPYEVEVLEISPSGLRVKLQFRGGSVGWKHKTALGDILEELVKQQSASA